eukprot:scaffold157575_cov38-Prasinocladus_malaysianus.AAC.1
MAGSSPSHDGQDPGSRRSHFSPAFQAIILRHMQTRLPVYSDKTDLAHDAAHSRKQLQRLFTLDGSKTSVAACRLMSKPSWRMNSSCNGRPNNTESIPGLFIFSINE